MTNAVETSPTAAPSVSAQKAKGSAKSDVPRAPGRIAANRQANTPAHKSSKQDLVVAMLRRTDGATLAAIMKATGWQKHSVHGFFAGVVRKKLQFNLVRIGEGDKAAYRIASGTSGCQSEANFDPSSACNFDPRVRRAEAVALASSEPAGVAETTRARVGT